MGEQQGEGLTQTELAWLRWVRRAAAGGPRVAVRLGIGDDAAVLRPRQGWEVALTTDLLLEDVHFLRRWDPAVSCGHRLATRALSDLAAMGAEPVALLVSTAYPQGLPPAWPRQLYRGLLAAAREAGAELVGGDVARAPGAKIFMDVVGVGQTPTGGALRRSGARVGDRIMVSGRLGEAALGRELAHAGKAPRGAAERAALARHRRPRARWELGLKLRGRATAAIDISDGLATDLDHLCEESGVGAEIKAVRIPGAEGAAGLRRALYGGEDYELLFTWPGGRRAPAGVWEIGRMVARSGRAPRIALLHSGGRRERLAARGWEHVW